MSDLAINIADDSSEPPPKPLFSDFVARSLAWVGVQLSITVAVASAMYIRRDEVIKYVNAYPGVRIATFVVTILFMIALFVLKGRCQRLTAFGMFTLSMSFMVGVGVLPYSPKTVFLAAATTWLIVWAAAAYSWRLAAKGEDVSGWGGPLLGVLTLVVVLNLANIFLKIPALRLALAGISVVLFTAYLIYDLVNLYSGRDANDPIFSDGLIAAVSIYLDIVNLFMNLLVVFDSAR
jgi:FtsH-binding integral membrane protein